MHSMQCLKLNGPRNFVRQSERLFIPFSCVTRCVPCATLSRTLWYAIALCFLLSIDSGFDTFVTTLWLSQKQFVGPSTGTPIILSLYRMPSFISVDIFSATNSLPKALLSIVFCRLEYHVIGAPFKKKIIPVVERRDCKQEAWEASQNIFICTELPLGSGILLGNGSSPIFKSG